MLPFAKKTNLKRLIHRTLWVRVDHVLYICAHDIRLHIVDANEPKNAQQAKQGT